MLQVPAVPVRAAEKLRSLKRLVGNTPLLAIDYRWHGRPRTIYAKCEHLNLTGSIKDRMALHILDVAYRCGHIAPGDRIAEATSGNTGISFAAIGRALGHPVTIFMPDWMSAERVNLIASFGADIVGVTRQQGGFRGSIDFANDLAASDATVFLPSQFANEANPEAHYSTTAVEIEAQLALAGRSADAFVAGVGTGGTVMGVGRYLRERNPAIRVHAVEPAESPTLSTGFKVGQHRIQGISDEFIPEIVELTELDDILAIHDGDAIVLAQRLASELGIGVGISSGANLLAAIEAQNRLSDDAVVVTVFPDSNKKYLSTDLLRKEPLREPYLSLHTELTGYTALPRVCIACAE
jgi:cysteine synthase A